MNKQPSIPPKNEKKQSCTEQMVWDAIFNQTPFIPFKISLNNLTDREEIENSPHIKAMVEYVFYSHVRPSRLQRYKTP
jgi:hypothetical protein